MSILLLALVVVLVVIVFARSTRALVEVEALRRELDELRAGLGAPSGPVAGPPEPTRPAEPALPVIPEAAPAAVVAEPAAPSVSESPAPTPVPAEAVAPIPPQPGPAAAAPPGIETLEARIGSRWLLYIGVVAIVVATSYFIKLAFDSRWITESMRVVIGAAGGLTLIWLGGRFARAGFGLYGQMLVGGGIAILYLAVYAAFNFYALIGQGTAFALMVGVTALAAGQADRHRSQGLAVMAVGGGFMTPFLVGGRTSSQTALFGYDAILVAGTAALARRRDWPVLNLIAYWLTVVTVGGWLGSSYTSGAYLQTVLFLTLFCALFSYILVRHRASPGPIARGTRRVLATAPALYYVVSTSLLYPHSLALLLFLIAVTVVGIIVNRRLDSSWGPLVLWLAVAVPLLAWVDGRVTASWVMPGGIVVMALYALQLVAQLDRLRHHEGALRAPDILLLHANALGSYILLYLLLDGWRLHWLGAIALGLAAWHVTLGRVTRGWHRETTVHFMAIGATLVTVAASLWLGGETMVVGWSVETAALTALGLRTGREWLRLAGAFLFSLGAMRLLGLLFGPIDAHYTILFNAKVATTLVAVVLLAALAFLHRWHGGPTADRVERDAEFFALAGHLLFLVLVTTEINAFFELRGGGRPAAMARAAVLAVAWTVQGAAVVRLGLSRRRSWLRLAGAVVLVVPLGWLLPTLWLTALANLAPPAGYVVFVNARAAAALVLVVALFGLAAMHARVRHALRTGGRPEIATAVLLGSLLTLGLLSAEISVFWRLRGGSAGTFEFARQLSLSITWAAFAAALIFVGIRRRYRPIRYLAIATFLVTILKVLIFDLSELERLYRVLSVAALGLLLLAASYMYQRFRDRLAADPPGPPDAGTPVS